LIDGVGARRQMNQRVRLEVSHDLLQRLRIEDAAHIVARRAGILVEAGDREPRVRQPPHQRLGDEASAAGDKNLHARFRWVYLLLAQNAVA
jgi:hypothetical protein